MKIALPEEGPQVLPSSAAHDGVNLPAAVFSDHIHTVGSIIDLNLLFEGKLDLTICQAN